LIIEPNWKKKKGGVTGRERRGKKRPRNGIVFQRNFITQDCNQKRRLAIRGKEETPQREEGGTNSSIFQHVDIQKRKRGVESPELCGSRHEAPQGFDYTSKKKILEAGA